MIFRLQITPSEIRTHENYVILSRLAVESLGSSGSDGNSVGDAWDQAVGRTDGDVTMGRCSIEGCIVLSHDLICFSLGSCADEEWDAVAGGQGSATSEQAPKISFQAARAAHYREEAVKAQQVKTLLQQKGKPLEEELDNEDADYIENGDAPMS